MAEPAFDLASLGDGLTDSEFSIGDTRFTIVKFGAMEAWRVLERIRKELAATDISIDGIDGGNTLLRSVLALDPMFVERLRQDLFKAVQFRNARAQSPLALAGSEDMAFDGLEPVAIYEVILRSLAVNFTASFHALASRLGGEGSPATTPSSQ